MRHATSARGIVGVLFAICLSTIPIIVLFKCVSCTRLIIATGILLVICWVILMNHTREWLRFRLFFFVLYTSIGILCILSLLFMASPARESFYLVGCAGLSMFPLLIPGVIRKIISLLATFRKRQGPGLCEALTLIVVHGPEMLARIMLLARYSLANRSFRTWCNTVLRVQWVPTLVVWTTTAMLQLASSAARRRFNVSSYEPIVKITSFETFTYLIALGGLAWLLLGA